MVSYSTVELVLPQRTKQQQSIIVPRCPPFQTKVLFTLIRKLISIIIIIVEAEAISAFDPLTSEGHQRAVVRCSAFRTILREFLICGSTYMSLTTRILKKSFSACLNDTFLCASYKMTDFILK